MARNWRDVRADAIAQGASDAEPAGAAREEMRSAVQAHRLAEIRKTIGPPPARPMSRRSWVSLRPAFPSLKVATCPTPSWARSRRTSPPWVASCASSPTSVTTPSN